MQNNDWEITTKRYVAYIDIMGFKDMVARQTHDEIYLMMKKIEESRKIISAVKWNKLDLVRTTNYSDSIMVYSKDDSSESLNSFICSIASMTDDLFKAEIPHKGAFAFGIMTLDSNNSIFFGQPLIDAYLLQEEVYFYGIVGHSTVERQLNNTQQILIHKFPCFFKNGISEHLTICPIHSQIDKTEEDEYLEDHKLLRESVKKLRHKTSGALRKYIDNTENYLNTLC